MIRSSKSQGTIGLAVHRLLSLPLIGMLLLSACDSDDEKAATGGTAQPMAVQVHVLKGEPLTNAFTTTGTLRANEQVELRSELSGRVTHIGFDEGARVKAGQVLVRINNDDLVAQLRKAEADLDLALSTEKRQQQLLDVKGVSEQAFENTQAQRIAREAEVENLKALIARSVIRAPFDGVIGLRWVSEGGFVTPNDPIATLSQIDPIKLDLSVPERYGKEIGPGSKVNFTTEGDTTNYTAEVYAVEPRVDPSTRTVPVRAKSRNPDGHLVPGSFARVSVTFSTLPNALLIPSEALIPDIQGQVVMLMKEGKAKTQRVQIGLRTETEVQLISGVQAGDTVITSGLLAIREGTPLRAAEPRDIPIGSDRNETGEAITEK